MVSIGRPLRRTQRHPNQKSQSICNDSRNSEGHGDEILSTLENDIVKCRKDTVGATQGGLREVFGGNMPIDLGFIMWRFKRFMVIVSRNYFAMLQNENLSKHIAMRTMQLRKRSKPQWANLKFFCAVNQEIIQISLGENSMGKCENYTI